jgi:RNA polymerase sigma-70 factor (ECF subfamily)
MTEYSDSPELTQETPTAMKDREFEDLVSAHYESLYRFAISLCHSEAEASDLTQQTFLRWAQRGFQLRDRSKAKTWLFTTLYREFLGGQRRSTRFPHVEIDDAGSDLPHTEPDTVNQLDGQSVMEALNGLDETYRAPLMLFYLKEHSYQEIASILAIPIGTVMSRLSRGKEQLRKRLVSIDQPTSGKTTTTPENVIKFSPATHTLSQPFEGRSAANE